MVKQNTDPTLFTLDKTEAVEVDTAAIAASGDARNRDYDPSRTVSAAAEDQGWAPATGDQAKAMSTEHNPKVVSKGGNERPGVNALAGIGDGTGPDEVEKAAAAPHLEALRAAGIITRRVVEPSKPLPVPPVPRKK